jgi:hypothetical protein
MGSATATRRGEMKGEPMAQGIRTSGWSTWIVVLVVVALIVIVGLMYLAQ